MSNINNLYKGILSSIYKENEKKILKNMKKDDDFFKMNEDKNNQEKKYSQKNILQTKNLKIKNNSNIHLSFNKKNSYQNLITNNNNKSFKIYSERNRNSSMSKISSKKDNCNIFIKNLSTRNNNNNKFITLKKSSIPISFKNKNNNSKHIQIKKSIEKIKNHNNVVNAKNNCNIPKYKLNNNSISSFIIYNNENDNILNKMDINSNNNNIFNYNNDIFYNNNNNNIFSHRKNKTLLNNPPVISQIILNSTNNNNNNNHNDDIIKDDIPNNIINIDINNINKDYNNHINLITSKISSSLVGLDNIGNTCFLNVCLQNLIHCKPFIISLFQTKLTLSKSKEITYAFLDLCLSIINEKNFNSISPKNFYKIFTKKHKYFLNYEQHDSVEVLRNLLEDISKELNIIENKPKYKELDTKGKSKVEQNEEYNKFFLERENSIVVEIFYSQMINIFVCKNCGFKSYSFEKILDIPLLFPENKINKNSNTDSNNNIIPLNNFYNIVNNNTHIKFLINKKKNILNVMDLIKKYFLDEDFQWESECENCHEKKIIHNKKIKFAILPKILIFTIQRINTLTEFLKNNQLIEIEEFIDLKEFIDEDLIENKDNNKFLYRLFGINNHSGSINYGHYYSYTKVNNCFFEFNDSYVSKINVNNISKNAYALFYEKI